MYAYEIIDRIRCSCRSAGKTVGQYDWDYCDTGMNFVGLGGFARLDIVLGMFFIYVPGMLCKLVEVWGSCHF